MEEDLINKIREFASEAHREQPRKYEPGPYIQHPVRVMQICSQYTDDISILAAALLHDVLEDTDTGKKEIRDFLSGLMDERQVRRTIRLVEELTDKFTKAKYPAFNRKKRKSLETERLAMVSKDAQTIKYADIIDNAISILNNHDDFAPVYLKEARNILRSLNSGNRTLYQLAVRTVMDGLRKVRRLNTES